MLTSESHQAPARRSESFPDFVEQHFKTAYHFAFCLSLAHDTASALSEAAFAKAESAKRADADGAIDKNWLLTTLHRDWVAREEAPGVAATKGANQPERASIRALDAAQLSPDLVLETLHAMNLNRRLVLSLFYFEQLNHLEIATILDLAPETALSRLTNAKLEFRQQLERRRQPASPTSPARAEGGRSE